MPYSKLPSPSNLDDKEKKLVEDFHFLLINYYKYFQLYYRFHNLFRIFRFVFIIFRRNYFLNAQWRKSFFCFCQHYQLFPSVKYVSKFILKHSLVFYNIIHFKIWNLMTVLINHHLLLISQWNWTNPRKK